MAFNPKMIMKGKQMFSRFENNHPRVLPFFHYIGKKATEGTIIEMKVIFPDGKESTCNIRVTEDDMELFREIGEMSK